MGEDGDFLDNLNPDSLDVLSGALGEPSLGSAGEGDAFQFERVGYFAVDPDSTPDRIVLNRTVTAGHLGEEGSVRGAAHSERAPRPEAPKGPVAEDDRVSPERRAARAADPSLAARFARFQEELGLSLDEADYLTGAHEVADFFESVCSTAPDAATAAAWIVNDLAGEAKGRDFSDLPFEGAALGTLAARVAEDRVTRRAARDVLAEMVEKGTAPDEIIARDGLEKISDASALEGMVDEVLAAWPEKVAEYRGGNRNLIGLFMGQVMKKSGGSADPGTVRTLLTSRLDS